MSRYDNLVELMETRPDLRELVRDLTITPRFMNEYGLADYRRLCPGILMHFPSVQILRIIGASADQLAEILVAPPDPTLLPLRHLSIDLSPDDAKKMGSLSWWKALPRFPNLAELTLHGGGSRRRRFQVVEQANPEGSPRMPRMDRVHTLTIKHWRSRWMALLPSPTTFPLSTGSHLKTRNRCSRAGLK